MIRVVVNGEEQQLSTSLSVLALLQQLELAGKRVAVELNGEIVPSSLHEQTLLQQDDRIEVVHAIGGG
ncbi:sulfur carrier protein ThiS [Balneatrix alpica]|uniref:Sulfur carrier protein ThiS n=1 Tax=Balneatrix alpica TaxID=75684 RepID=A0ABV5ZAZ3_9GAMM|nr:sulfur carrier protein ThiS [Balneatrix alpica]